MDKQNKNFHSNADMIRHYFAKLLGDGKEHEKSEIVEYILAETNGKGLDGREITYLMISNAVREAVAAPNSMHMNTRRGYYRQITYNANAKSVLDAMAKAIEKGKADFDKSHIIDISKCDISGSELLGIQNAIERIDGLLAQALEVTKETLLTIQS